MNATLFQSAMDLEFSLSCELMRARDEAHRWRCAAGRVSISRPGTDISTPEKFQSAQLDGWAKADRDRMVSFKEIGELRKSVQAKDELISALQRVVLSMAEVISKST